MRKYLLVITLALIVCITAKAQSVSKAVAEAKATSFLQLKSNSQLQLLKSPYETLYLFAIDGGGFVIVSADSRVQPILGYSLQSNLDMGNLPANLADWLESYDKQIRAAMEDATLPTHSGWSEQGMPKSGVDGYDSIVGPLLTTTWDQSPYYNDLCPLSGGIRTLTGCIATAMAQVMKYWNWPASGVGQHSYSTINYDTLSADFGSTIYDWSNMPTRLTSSSSTAQVTAVATLMYHCGVAVNMRYDVDGSGIRDNIMYNHGLNHPCPENALRTYFKYSPALYGVRRGDFTSEEWAALLKNEIDHRRPVLYAGANPNVGHEFVCDGYDTNGYFHFNWGWSGEADGYFALSRLNPSGHDYTGSQSVIVGIEPDTLFGSSATCTVNATSANSAEGTVTGDGLYNYRDTVLLYARATQGHRFLRWSNGSTVNPYPCLAHDFSITAHFCAALAEDGEVLSYTGDDVTEQGFYSFDEEYRIGIKLPATVLGGHNYVSAVDLYHYRGDFVIYIHRGGDDAPGPVVYTQPVSIPNGEPRWCRAKLETSVPIDTNNNLWITLRRINDFTNYMGIPGLGVSDGNWISIDNGANWGHLDQLEPNTQLDDTSICWFIRCVTSADSVVNTNLAPTAFILAPERGYIDDTVVVELLRSTASTVEWDFGDADAAHVSSDSAFIVWNTTGYHPVGAMVTSPCGSVAVSDTVLINDCNNPVSTFPYVINYNQQDVMLRGCWQWFYRGGSPGYPFPTDYISIYLGAGTDNWYVSPLIDLTSDEDVWLELNHITSSNCLITVELSQGGVESEDFTTIYTLPTNDSETPVMTEPINLTEHNQGNPVRIAIRMQRQEGPGRGMFELHGLRIWEGTVGIGEVVSTTLSVRPNPARQLVSVTLPDPDGTLTLFDASGRQLVQHHTSSTQTTVDVSALPQGVYLLQYTSPRGTSTTRFVVQ